MVQNSPELRNLSRKERRLYFKELTKKHEFLEKRGSLIRSIIFALTIILIVIGLSYFWLTAQPAAQDGLANQGLLQTSNLKVGSQAPDFNLNSATGGRVSLTDFLGKNLLLYFQEGLMCQPCWKQISSLEKDLVLFEKIQTDIVTVGVDSAQEWQPILQAEGVTKIPVLVDADREMSKDYGVLSMPSQMHPDRPGHTFVLVNKDRKIAWIADYPTMRVSNTEIINSITEALKKEI